ncbi:MAG: DUF4126 domain-containing protein [Candidatus Hydrogenedentes bacterium]|nr:DUF4126 domain-containing protein [Candidatus Hydrogenedentota bacterium]
MEILTLLGTALGLGFISGLNLYATVLAIGLGIRLGFFDPAPPFDQLEVLAHPYVLIPAAIAFTLEFFADKVPWVDSFWDSFHTIIRPVGAIVIAAAAITDLDPAIEVGLVILCGGVAFLSHTTKAGTRLAANHSPEPFSNILLSLAEDAIAFIGAWLIFAHPIVLLTLVVLFVALALWLLPKLIRLIARQVSRVRLAFRSTMGRIRGTSTNVEPS